MDVSQFSSQEESALGKEPKGIKGNSSAYQEGGGKTSVFCLNMAGGETVLCKDPGRVWLFMSHCSLVSL